MDNSSIGSSSGLGIDGSADDSFTKIDSSSSLWVCAEKLPLKFAFSSDLPFNPLRMPPRTPAAGLCTTSFMLVKNVQGYHIGQDDSTIADLLSFLVC